MKKFLIIAFFPLVFACQPTSKNEGTSEEVEDGSEYIEYNNPPAEGFDQEGSDLLATLLADKVMSAMGGRKAWDETRFISWNFFGRRTHIWDKLEGDVRIEEPSNNLTILMNIHSEKGKVMIGGEEVSNPDSLSKYLDMGKRYWINDSYWLVMPYKLKDSGVTLRYIGEDTTQLGEKSDIIRMSFKDVGVTPQNVYDVWVDVESKFVTQWAYYTDANQEEPRFTTPWSDYKKYGTIYLSGDRGDYKLSDIKVLQEVPPNTFDSFEIVAL
ncbi:MAG: hypothetical protein AAGA66_18760 [Bacteroidota bacterium]